MTDEEMIEEFKNKHLESYKKAVQEIVKNNTKSLIEEDIFSLIKKPPLDSMDVIKGKLLSLAKSKHLILESEHVDSLVEDFRKSLKTHIMQLKEVREQFFVQKIEEFQPVRETETIKITTKDLTHMNKLFTQKLKKQLVESVGCLQSNIHSIYASSVKEEEKKEVNTQFIKYMKGPYQKQLFENIAMKMMIKDRTLVNGINEQGERYLFTKGNSYIFHQEEVPIKNK